MTQKSQDWPAKILINSDQDPGQPYGVVDVEFTCL